MISVLDLSPNAPKFPDDWILDLITLLLSVFLFPTETDLYKCVIDIAEQNESSCFMFYIIHRRRTSGNHPG